MGPLRRALTGVVLILMVAALSACSGALRAELSAAGAEPAVTYTDPFAYCAVVGTADVPGHRYVGPKVPRAIAEGLRQAFGLPDTAPLEPFIRNTYWRCMDGKVYACNVGANLPCLEKADIGTRPSEAMVTWCRENSTAAAIPAVVTGRRTVYVWRCQKGTPAIVRQVTAPDARGFLSNIWYPIEPVRRPRTTP